MEEALAELSMQYATSSTSVSYGYYDNSNIFCGAITITGVTPNGAINIDVDEMGMEYEGPNISPATLLIISKIRDLAMQDTFSHGDAAPYWVTHEYAPSPLTPTA